MNTRFFLCSICGQLIHTIEDKDLPLTCCMTEMTELIPNAEETGKTEYHIPVYSRHENKVKVYVGKEAHPMTPEHYIKWIFIHTRNGCQRKELKSADQPYAEFYIAPDDEILSVYAYCNIHGLWKS